MAVDPRLSPGHPTPTDVTLTPTGPQQDVYLGAINTGADVGLKPGQDLPIAAAETGAPLSGVMVPAVVVAVAPPVDGSGVGGSPLTGTMTPAVVVTVAPPQVGALGLLGTTNGPALVVTTTPVATGALGLSATLTPAVVPTVAPNVSGSLGLTATTTPAVVPVATPAVNAALGLTGVSTSALVVAAQTQAEGILAGAGALTGDMTPGVTPVVTPPADSTLDPAPVTPTGGAPFGGRLIVLPPPRQPVQPALPLTGQLTAAIAPTVCPDFTVDLFTLADFNANALILLDI